MTKKDFVKKIFKLAVVLDGQRMDEKAEIYWEFLKEYSEPELDEAFAFFIKTSTFFPKIAEIIEVIHEIRKKNYLRQEANQRQKEKESWLAYYKTKNQEQKNDKG